MKRGKSRQLSAAEKSLWNSVASTVVPMPDRSPLNDLPQTSDQRSTVAPARPAALKPRPSNPEPTTPQRPTPLHSTDPQRERLVRRGRLTIDAVIDLHGLRQDESDQATAAFINRSIGQGHRVLLVITGKGSKDGHQGRGVLRKRFLQNMELGLFGGAITSVRPAHQKHGGQGAFYVFLRAPKSRAGALTDRHAGAVTKPSRSHDK